MTNYAKIKPVDVANGSGVRVSLFVSGCTHHCKGCFNSELWDHAAGEELTDDVILKVLDLCDKPYIRGLSLLGGEPLDPNNIQRLLLLCRLFKIRYPHKDIWCYTGYLWDQVKRYHIMKYIDVLVDGKFVQNFADPRLKFRGSKNQRIIDVKKSLEHDLIFLRGDLM